MERAIKERRCASCGHLLATAATKDAEQSLCPTCEQAITARGLSLQPPGGAHAI